MNIDVLGCPQLTAPEYGTMDDSEGWLEGANVFFTCDPYTQMNGPAVRTCQSNNTWSGNNPVCGQYIFILCVCLFNLVDQLYFFVVM